MNVGQKLKALRKARRLSQAQVAEGINCSPNTYSRYERGTREPSVAMLSRLADFFGVSMDYLFSKAPISGADLSPFQRDLLEAADKHPYEVQDKFLDFLNYSSNKEGTLKR